MGFGNSLYVCVHYVMISRYVRREQHCAGGTARTEHFILPVAPLVSRTVCSISSDGVLLVPVPASWYMCRLLFLYDIVNIMNEWILIFKDLLCETCWSYLLFRCKTFRQYFLPVLQTCLLCIVNTVHCSVQLYARFLTLFHNNLS